MKNQTVYGSIQIRDLNPYELKRIILPDDYLVAIWVDFSSSKGNKYMASHSALMGENCPYNITLATSKVSSDFSEVERIIIDSTGGIILPGEPYTRGESEIAKQIGLKTRPTQRVVAEYVEAYRGRFRNVGISLAYFSNVPVDVKASHLIEEGRIKREW